MTPRPSLLTMLFPTTFRPSMDVAAAAEPSSTIKNTTGMLSKRNAIARCGGVRERTQDA